MRIPICRAPFRASLLVASLFLAGCSDTTTGPRSATRDGIAVPTSTARRDITPTGFIRVGVVPSAASVAIGSPGDYVVRDESSGTMLLDGSNGSATVTYAGVVSKYRLQVVCASTATVDARKAAAQAAGYVTYTEYVPAAHCTRLFLGEFASNASFSVRNAFRSQAIAGGFAGTDSFWKIVGSGVPLYVITRGADVVQTPNPVTLTSSTNRVTINGVAYRGTAEVRVNGAGTLAGINELPMEEYLYGVVPAELNPVIWPQMEAIKAQAVAARTYALAGLGKRAADGYDLLATTADQVYGGLAYEKATSNDAVDATRGVVATYDGHPISALYSSTSGGHTANNEEAFNSSAVAYLRGVPDAERGAATDHVPTLEVFRAAANPLSLRGVHAGEFENDWSRWHRWTFQWSAAEMSQVASLFAGQPVGSVRAVEVLERGPSGRAVRLEFVTDAGALVATKDAIRAALKYVTADGTLANLPSTLFFIEPVLDHRSGNVVGFEAYGGGLGHGVGLSQTGAVGMAQHGHSFDEILAYYYHGIDLTTWY